MQTSRQQSESLPVDFQTETRYGHKPVVNQPVTGWPLPDLAELWEFRSLLRYMITSQLKVRYKQTVLGAAWAIVNPLITMVLFTLVFGEIAKVETYGIPYPIFSFAGLVPWTLFSKGLGASALSMAGGRGIIDKVYFPRLLMPLSRIFTGLVDFGLSLGILLLMTMGFGYTLNMGVFLLLPLALLGLITALGLGLILASLYVRFRDIKYSVPFITQALLYLSPVVYPSNLISEELRVIYALNPMVTVCDGFRQVLLGIESLTSATVTASTVTALVILIVGMIFFERLQSRFPDLI